MSQKRTYKVIHTLQHNGRVYRPGEIVELDLDTSQHVSFAVAEISKSSIAKEDNEESQDNQEGLLSKEKEAPKRRSKKKS